MWAGSGCFRRRVGWRGVLIENAAPLLFDEGRSKGILSWSPVACHTMEASDRVPQLSTRDMGNGVQLKGERRDRIQTLIDRMLTKCCGLSRQLNEMKRFSAIDLAECSSLLEILRCNYGWLQRVKRQIEDDAFVHIAIPLVRYELEIWYADRRIEAIFGVVAASEKDSIEKHARNGSESEYENLVCQIDEVVSRRDVSFITEPFADAVSGIAYLGARQNPASVFFDNNVLCALTTIIAPEKWDESQVNQLEVEHYGQLRKIATAVDRAISIAEKFAKGNYPLTRASCARRSSGGSTGGTDRIALYVSLQDIANVDMLWYKVARELSNTIPALANFRMESEAGLRFAGAVCRHTQPVGG